MAKLKVDTEAMRKVDETLEASVADMARLMTAMRDEVAGLDGSWEGPNHDAFVSDFERRKEVVKAHGLALERFVASFGQAVRLYQQLEDELVRAVSVL